MIREEIENREYKFLSENAKKTKESLGRRENEEPCELRTDFQRDRDRIVHSKAFRRLMHKTQVFLAPEGDHYTTRLTHTIEVSQISRTVARALRLNEDLTEAIALGHDLGHTPFGHTGEEALNLCHEGGFLHNEQSLRIVDVLERRSGNTKQGMNLTFEVRDGIVNHTGKNLPATHEGKIVRICDRIAYVNHDIDDAIRSGVLEEADLPKAAVAVLGRTHRQRIDTLVKDLVKHEIKLSPEKEEAMNELRGFLFKNVYKSDIAQREKVFNMIQLLYSAFLKDQSKLPEESIEMINKFGLNTVICDHIAGMTDRYAMKIFSEIYIPKTGSRGFYVNCGRNQK